MLKAGDPVVQFVEKWQAREPEMRIAEVFCIAVDKTRFRTWGALLHALRETLFELSDPQVTGVKSAWWAEELIQLAQGLQRHPLSAALLEIPAAWPALGRALLQMPTGETRAEDTAQAIDALMPVARAFIDVEAAMFSGPASETAARSLAVHWLMRRLPVGLSAADQARIPMHLLARHATPVPALAERADHPLLRDWGRELLTATPSQLPGSSNFRRSQHAFDRARLQRLAAGKGWSRPAPVPTLWRAWRAARGDGWNAASPDATVTGS